VLEASAAELGATLTARQHAPGFERYVVARDAEAVVVDLVLERVPQTAGAKRTIGSITVDPIEEILANKLTTVLSRAEERDLVDLLFIERQGLRVEDGLRAAQEKDGGCTPGALAWVLAEVSIPDGAILPAGVTAEELRGFVADLVVRLRRAAFPGSAAQ
jgi:hypothetical protein